MALVAAMTIEDELEVTRSKGAGATKVYKY